MEHYLNWYCDAPRGKRKQSEKLADNTKTKNMQTVDNNAKPKKKASKTNQPRNISGTRKKHRRQISIPREQQQQNDTEENAYQQCHPRDEKRRRRTEEYTERNIQKNYRGAQDRYREQASSVRGNWERTMTTSRNSKNATKCTSGANAGQTPRGRRQTDRNAARNPRAGYSGTTTLRMSGNKQWRNITKCLQMQRRRQNKRNARDEDEDGSSTKTHTLPPHKRAESNQTERRKEEYQQQNKGETKQPETNSPRTTTAERYRGKYQSTMPPKQ